MDIHKNGFGVLYLTNNENTMGLYRWLKDQCTVYLYSEQLEVSLVQQLKPDLVVSYNYKYIIKDEVLDRMQGRIINLHISLLPWNRGSSPNIWSFIDHTPKGVTIHRVSARVDQGDIICQQECVFDERKETFESAYCKLHRTIVELFQQNWEDLKRGTYQLRVQQGKGSYHNKKDLEELMDRCPFSWSDSIADFMERYDRTVKC